MLVLLPPRCQCAAALRWLTAIGLRAGAPTYLVATAQTRPLALRLYGELGVRLSNSVSLAMDARGVLPAAYPPHGLTAVLISGSKVVSVASEVTTASNPAAITRALLG
jgi:hypothetical protein